MEYELRLFDTPVCRFTMGLEGLKGFQVHIAELYNDNPVLLPLGLSPDDDSLKEWLKGRVIPKNRAFVHEILKKFGLSVHDTAGIIDVCKGLSLNDSFWVVPADFTGKFADYNLYENDLDDILALVAYTGVDGGYKVHGSSPELTTDGALPKAWRIKEDGCRVLYKGGTTGACNTGREPFSEYLASAVAEKMGLDAIKYGLEKWKGTLCSTCKAFTDINTSYTSFYAATHLDEAADVLRYYMQLSDDSFEKVASMFVFDSLIMNEDRHIKNFGLLRNNKTGEVLGPAPIFDNGFSLFNFVQDEDLHDLLSYRKGKLTGLYVDFDDMAKYVMGPIQKEQLKKMIGFKFPRHPVYNLPEKRLKTIEGYLQDRLQELLRMPNHDRNQLRSELGLPEKSHISLCEQIQSASTRAAESHLTDKTPAKEIAPDR